MRWSHEALKFVFSLTFEITPAVVFKATCGDIGSHSSIVLLTY